MQELLRRNQEFANALPARVADAVRSRFAEKKGQSPRIAFIDCSDSFSITEGKFNAGPNTLFVTRNIANIVPKASVLKAREKGLSAYLTYAVNHLKVGTIVVGGHYDCGGIKALTALGLESRGHHLEEDIAAWVSYAAKAKQALDTAISKKGLTASPEDYHKALVETNVLHSLSNVFKHPAVEKAVAAGTLKLMGVVTDFESYKVSS